MCVDCVEDLHGTHALYTTLKNEYEVIFHVSTWLPYVESDPQKVNKVKRRDFDWKKIERKRHIGNDTVVVIFKEGTEAFDPAGFKSQYNRVFFLF